MTKILIVKKRVIAHIANHIYMPLRYIYVNLHTQTPVKKRWEMSILHSFMKIVWRHKNFSSCLCSIFMIKLNGKNVYLVNELSS